MATAAIVGGSGYSGQETLDRVLGHPELELVALGSDSLAGEPATVLDPRLARNGHRLPAFVPNEEALGSGADVVFLCLDHERAAGVEPPPEGVVVDLSGAHRLSDGAAYETWYGFTHPQPGSLAEWSYAVPELGAPTGRLVANPGCYATAALLALAPLVGAVEPASVVVDAKSGVSGAGKALRPSSHANAVLENLSPYKVGRHQHAAELARVQGTDEAEIGLFEDRATGRAVIVCAIDNLGKGAAGQAVQNANLALGLPEAAGLRLHGVLV